MLASVTFNMSICFLVIHGVSMCHSEVVYALSIGTKIIDLG